VEQKPSKADIEPLYSSFNPKGIFKAPPSSKEFLLRQKEKDAEEAKNNHQKSNQSQIFDNDTTAMQVLSNDK